MTPNTLFRAALFGFGLALAQVPGVAQVRLDGVNPREVRVNLRVADLDAVKAAVADAPVVMAERETFYGSRELGVQTPGGHRVTFAQFA